MTSVEDAIASTVMGAPPFAPIAAPRVNDTLPRVGFTPRVTPTLERRRLWERRYRRHLQLTDVIIVIAAAVLTSLIQIQLLDAELLLADPWIIARIPMVSAATWLVMLASFHTRDSSIAGAGATEYKRVVHATGLAFGILAIAFVIFQWQGIRMQLVLALPVGLLGLLINRWSWRQWLTRQRAFGHYVSRAVVVGRRDDVEHVISTLQANGKSGYLVVGATIDESTPDALEVGGRKYTVAGSLHTVAETANELGADAIIVASRPQGDPDFVKRLSWQLEGTASELVLSSRLTDVAGPRISLRQVEGLPLIHVKIPDFEGGQHMLKRALDIGVASIALILFAPFVPFIALAIALDSRGPVFFSQKRVGRDGREFRVLKFRSMRTTAEAGAHGAVGSERGLGTAVQAARRPARDAGRQVPPPLLDR